MIQPFLGEIRAFAGQGVPSDWTRCDGKTLSLDDYPELFALIGTTYGGSGDYFQLPDLQARVAMHREEAADPPQRKSMLGETGGAIEVVLGPDQFPTHRHDLQSAGATGTTNVPEGALLSGGANNYLPYVPKNEVHTPLPLDPTTIGSTGVDAGHPNVMPTMGLNYCIAVRGEMPPIETGDAS